MRRVCYYELKFIGGVEEIAVEELEEVSELEIDFLEFLLFFVVEQRTATGEVAVGLLYVTQLGGSEIERFTFVIQFLDSGKQAGIHHNFIVGLRAQW